MIIFTIKDYLINTLLFNILLVNFLVITIELQAQSSCGGYEYIIDTNKDIPKGYFFVKSYRIDDKQGGNEQITYTYSGEEGEDICLVVRGHCTENLNIRLVVTNIKGEEIASNIAHKKLQGKNYIRLPKKNLYFFQFSFEKQSCRNCGVAFLSKKNE